MTARKSLPRFSATQRNRLSIQSHQSQISAVLDPDSYVDSNDEDNPLWFKGFENHSINPRPSARFSLAQSLNPILNSDSEPESTPLEKSWWKRVADTPDVRGSTVKVSGDQEWTNSGEVSISESSHNSLENEAVKKRKPVPRRKKRKSLQKNIFSEILEASKDSIRSDANVPVATNKETQHSRSNSESSDNSALDEIITKKRPAVLLKKRKRSQKDVFSEILESPKHSMGLEKQVRNAQNEEEAQDRSDLESSEVSLPEQLVAKKRPASHFRKRNSLQPNIFSETPLSPQVSVPHGSNNRDIIYEEEQQNQSNLESSVSSSSAEIVAKKKLTIRRKNRQSLESNVFSDILQSSKSRTTSEQNIQDAPNNGKSDVEFSDISLDEGVPKKKRAPHFKQRRNLQQDVFSELLESSKESNSSEQSLQGTQADRKQRTVTPLSMSDISLEKPREPTSKQKNNAQLLRRSIDMESKSDKESSPDAFEDALDTFESVRKSRDETEPNEEPGINLDSQNKLPHTSISIAETDQLESEDPGASSEDSGSTIHLAVGTEGSRSPIIMAHSKVQSITKTNGRKSENFNEANAQLDDTESQPADLGWQNVTSVDEDDSAKEGSIEKERVPFAQNKRNSKQKRTFSELLESRNISIQSEEPRRCNQTGEFTSTRLDISSSSVQKPSSKKRGPFADAFGPLNAEKNKNDSASKPKQRSRSERAAKKRSINMESNHSDIAESLNKEVEPDRSNIINKSGDQKQSTNQQDDDLEISGTLNDELQLNDSENTPIRPSRGSLGRGSIQNKKSFNESQIDEKQLHIQKKTSLHGKRTKSMTKDSSKSNIKMRQVEILSSENRIEVPRNLLNLSRTSSKNSAERRSTNIELEDDPSDDERPSLDLKNIDPDIAEASDDELEKEKSETTIKRSIQHKNLNQSQINIERLSTQGKNKTYGANEKTGNKHSLKSSNAKGDKDAVDKSQRLSRNRQNDRSEAPVSPNIEVAENYQTEISESPDIGINGNESISKEFSVDTQSAKQNYDLETPASPNTEPEKNHSTSTLPQTSRTSSQHLHASISGRIHETKTTETHPMDQRSKPRDRTSVNLGKTAFSLNEFTESADRNKIQTSKSHKSFMLQHRETPPEQSQESNPALAEASRMSHSTAGTKNREIDPLQQKIGRSFSSTVRAEAGPALQTSGSFNIEKMSQIKSALDKVKSTEFAILQNRKIDSYFKQVTVKKANIDGIGQNSVKQLSSKTQSTQNKRKTTDKITNKAYLVNGRVYHRPRLPRPKPWATDKLYKFLWKRLEQKYTLRTRVRSEQFVLDLGKVVEVIQRRKKYENYREELNNLIHEMAHLGIIKTRHEFNIFCQNFLPHSFRIKVIPMILPGNVSNIPFKPEELHKLILDI